MDFVDLVLGACQDAFGETVTWQSALLAAPVQVQGIFDEGYSPFDGIGGDDGVASQHVSSATPVLGIRLIDWPGQVRQGDLLTIRNRLYRIREVQPDSHGAAKLLLNNAERENDPLPR
ncbi:hypothetical protein AA23498_1367 [Acetobacter nitrogenifigens DSM 23921 = NBRC 105050]|nr:hypothetical protein AA23498_1367 [Acetobacter nitrogenifigens DSM 23921 = NBRC 105050]